MPAAAALTVTVEAPEPVTAVGESATFRPREYDEVRATIPEKPLSAAIARVEAPDDPASIVRFTGLAEMVKSTTLTVMVGAL